MYAKLENGQYKIVARPRWLDDIGRPVPDSVLIAHGYLPVEYGQPEYDPATQTVSKDPQDQWVVEPDRLIVTYTVKDIPTEVLRTRLKAAVTAKRWEIETGGLELPTGVRVKTGIDDQNRITSVIANARRAEVAAVDFKAETGWVTLSIVQVEGIADAISVFVQQCFSAEKAHHEAIDLLVERDDIILYDYSTGWPTT